MIEEKICIYCYKNKANSKLSPSLCVDCHQAIAKYNGNLFAAEPRYTVIELEKISKTIEEDDFLDYPRWSVERFIKFLKNKKKVEEILK